MVEYTLDDLITDQICAAIRRILGLRADRVEPHHRLVEDLRCESIDLVEIPMAIEDRFAIAIDDDEAEACRTISDYVALAREKIAGKQAQARVTANVNAIMAELDRAGDGQ